MTDISTNENRPVRLKAPKWFTANTVYSGEIGLLPLSKNRTVVTIAGRAKELFDGGWTEVTPAPKQSEVPRYSSRKRIETTPSPQAEYQRRIAGRIRDFQKKHEMGKTWISFARIDKWAKGNSSRPGFDELNQAFNYGKFGDSRSQVLFLSPACFARCTREDGSIFARPFLRFSQSDFELAALTQEPSVLTAAYLSHFWIPRSVCEQWFREQDYELPPWLEGSSAPAVKSAKPKSGKIPLIIEYLETHFPEGVPDPARVNRQMLTRDLIAAIPAMQKSLDPKTLKKAIDQHNEKVSQKQRS
jgi:hypothetical protein